MSVNEYEQILLPTDKEIGWVAEGKGGTATSRRGHVDTISASSCHHCTEKRKCHPLSGTGQHYSAELVAFLQQEFMWLSIGSSPMTGSWWILWTKQLMQEPLEEES